MDEAGVKRSLEIGDVHVYGAKLTAESLEDWLTLERFLGDDERRRRDRFLFERDRHVYTLAHGMLRWALSQYADVKPGEWEFHPDAFGRPELSDRFKPLGLRFNLSHTTALAVVAVTREMDVGIDVERLDRRASTELVATSFAAAEQAELERCSPENFLERFFEIWTLKEAYIKGRGMGLRIPLETFAFLIGASGDLVFEADPTIEPDPTAWSFRRLQPWPESIVSVAARVGHGELRLVWSELSPADITVGD